MLRKTFLGIAFLAMSALTLSSCTLTPEGEQTAQKSYDTICKAEPQLYASFVVVATAKQASEATMTKAALAHDTVTDLCTNRPTDIVAASVLLANAYAKFVAINATVERRTS